MTRAKKFVMYALIVSLPTAACSGGAPISPEARSAIEDACDEVLFLRNGGPSNRGEAVGPLTWGETRAAMAGGLDSRAEQLATHVAEMKKILLSPDGRSANSNPDVARFAEETEAAANECVELEERL